MLQFFINLCGSSLDSLPYVHAKWWSNFSLYIKQVVEEKKYDRKKSTAAKSDRFNKGKNAIGL